MFFFFCLFLYVRRKKKKVANEKKEREKSLGEIDVFMGSLKERKRWGTGTYRVRRRYNGRLKKNGWRWKNEYRRAEARNHKDDGEGKRERARERQREREGGGVSMKRWSISAPLFPRNQFVPLTEHAWWKFIAGGVWDLQRRWRSPDCWSMCLSSVDVEALQRPVVTSDCRAAIKAFSLPALGLSSRSSAARAHRRRTVQGFFPVRS